MGIYVRIRNHDTKYNKLCKVLPVVLVFCSAINTTSTIDTAVLW